jgi:hypothetical protein
MIAVFDDGDRAGRSDGGIVRPRAFAVLRLITTPAPSAVRSPGLAHFKILSTTRRAPDVVRSTP